VCFPDALADEVPKVPKAPLTPFWHFWHSLQGDFAVLSVCRSVKPTLAEGLCRLLETYLLREVAKIHLLRCSVNRGPEP
jgi:hypothetical protein